MLFFRAVYVYHDKFHGGINGISNPKQGSIVSNDYSATENFSRDRIIVESPLSTIMREVLKSRKESCKYPPFESPISVLNRVIVNLRDFVRNVAIIVNAVRITAISFTRIFRRIFVQNGKIHHMFVRDVCNGCTKDYRRTLRKYFISWLPQTMSIAIL